MEQEAAAVVLCKCGCGGTAPIYREKQCSYLYGHAGAKVVRRTERYKIDPETQCWVWQLYTAGRYGIERHEGKPKKAHRNYYEKHKGPIPEGYVIDHLCRNRACVNPDHLEAVTPGENSRRGTNSTVDRTKISAIRELFNTGKFTKTQISGVFGLSISCVCDIISGKTWS